MKSINLLMVLFTTLGTTVALADQKASDDKLAFEVKNVECVFLYQDETMKKAEEVKMIKADINGMIPIPAAHVASFKKGDYVYQALIGGVEKHDNRILAGVEVTVTNTKKDHYGYQMLKGALVLSSENAYGFLATTNSQQDKGDFVDTSLTVACAIPARIEK